MGFARQLCYATRALSPFSVRFRDLKSGKRLSLLLAVLVAASLLVLVPALSAVAEVSQVASSCQGSSDATLYPSNHRLASTQLGRLLAVYDPHGSGVQFTWRDPGGAWQTTTSGAMSNGLFPGDIENDRPASIAVSKDSLGVEHAWVVWGGYTYSKISALKMRRISNLDMPAALGGPTVGPEVTLEPAGRGNNRPDIAFRLAGLASGGAVTWTKRTGDSTYQLLTGWLSSLDTDSPVLQNRAVVYEGARDTATGTLVPTTAGMSLVIRLSNLRLYRNDVASPSTWTGGVAGLSSSYSSYPSAVELASGDVLATVESDTSAHVVKVVRLSADGARLSTSLTTPSGFSKPAIASDGTRAWVFMVRYSDKSLRSRAMGADGTWGPDVSELPGGDYSWPNTVRNASGSVRLLVDGAKCPTSSSRNAVSYYEKPTA